MRVITRKTIGRLELHICDDFADQSMVDSIGRFVTILPYRRTEHSRPNTPLSGATAEIADGTIAGNPFFHMMRELGEALIAGRYEPKRVYVNSSIYGDLYLPHRDCSQDERDITVLYYANTEWEMDWGGETIFYNDHGDAELAVNPKPNRVVVAHGAILHRAGVPTRAYYGQRYTIAYKLRALNTSS